MKQHVASAAMVAAGEGGMVVQLGGTISLETNALVQALTQLLLDSKEAGILEVVPAYCSVTVYFDPLVLSRSCLEVKVQDLLLAMVPKQLAEPARLIQIPVCYGGVLGPDLELVARHAGLTAEQVIQLHTQTPYLVYMLGYTPGFPYLGGLNEGLALPRRKVPRGKVPRGSVGIGGRQTGIYPVESPGEWWLIGRTPLDLFNPQEAQPFLLFAGDYVQFVAVDIETYFSVRRKVNKGGFVPRIGKLEKGQKI